MQPMNHKPSDDMALADIRMRAAELDSSEADPVLRIPQKKDRERGATLLFALAILALLVLFSTVFARLMSLERRASAYYTDRVRAKLAARAGIERAIVELRAVAGQQHFSDPYTGRWDYHAFTNPGACTPALLPANEELNLLNTVYPSFFQVDDPDGNPATNDSRLRYGTPITYSGYLGAPYDDSMMVYRLKIFDTGRQLNLNHPDSRAANRMLATLLEVASEDAYDNDTDFTLNTAEAQRVADILIDANAGETYQRFRSKPQIGEAFVEAMVTVLGQPAAPLPTDHYDNVWNRHVRDMITVYSWEDPDVIRPWALNRPEWVSPPGRPDLSTQAASDLNHSDKPRKNLSLMPRAPININTASVPVLMTLFNGLSAETRYGTFHFDLAAARAIAQAIADRRGGIVPTTNNPYAPGYTGTYTPFRSWTEFEQWIDGNTGNAVIDNAVNALFAGISLHSGTEFMTSSDSTLVPTPWQDVTGAAMDWAASPGDSLPHAVDGGLYHKLQEQYRSAHRDMVKAMLNPNTMISKFGQMPNHGGFKRRYPRLVDKTDLVRITTEGCFDSLGVFEITSTGLIFLRDPRDPAVGYEVHAGHTDLVVVRVYTPFRLTTQRQFEDHRAFMVQGNYIITPETLPLGNGGTAGSQYTNLAGANPAPEPIAASTNAGDYIPVPNGDPAIPDDPYRNPVWPGMVTWPQYSVKRVDTNFEVSGPNQTVKFPMPTTYGSATWDGHMTLTNMITVRTGGHDFLAGFSRGKLDAFKCRAWWENLDVEYSGAYRPTGLGGEQMPTRPTYKESHNGTNYDFVALPSKEMRYLSKPLTGATHSPKLDNGAGFVSVLAEEFPDPGQPIPLNPSGMFTEGTALTNTGIMLGQDRPAANGQAAFVAFDSNNVDLNKGTSIRFWVQPLRDPYVQKEETLFYFNGSNGTEAGNKRANPPGTPADQSGWPRPLRTATDGPEDMPRHGVKQEGGFRVFKRVNPLGDIEIVLEDLGVSPQHKWSKPTKTETTVIVTPSLMKGAGTTTELNKPDPTAPEWIPGTWHWVVINIGPGLVSGLRRQSFASLQVDKCDLSKADNTGEIWFSGDNWTKADPTTDHGYGGEVLAHMKPFTGGLSDFIEPVLANTGTPAGFDYRMVPRQLGDFYHCTQHDPLSTTVSQNMPAGTGQGAVLAAITKEYGGAGNTALQYSGGAWKWFNWVLSGPGPGWYVQGPGWPAAPFARLVSNRKLAIRFYTQGGAPSGVGDIACPYIDTAPIPSPPGWQPGWTPQFPKTKINGPSPFGPASEGGYSVGAPRGVSGNGLLSVPYPGNQEWAMSVVATWDETHFMGRSPWAARRWATGPYLTAGGNTTWLPNDLTLLDPVDWTADMGPLPAGYEQSGGRLPYAVNNSGAHSKNTATQTLDDDSPDPYFVPITPPVGTAFTNYIRTRTPITIPDYGALPLDTVGDDCHGCEDCDLDGPVFIGAQPAGTQNYKASGEIADADLLTVTCSIIDNLVFVNGDPKRRTDYPTLNNDPLFGAGGISLVSKPFEDRFFEEDLAAYLTDGTSGQNQPAGTGAVYHRGLLELRNRRFRLASMTWTSYPTRVTGLNYEVALWKIDDIDPLASTLPNNPVPRFRYANTGVSGVGGLLNESVYDGQRDNPHFGTPNAPAPGTTTIAYATDPNLGITFGKTDFAARKIDFLTDFFLTDDTVQTNGIGPTSLIRSPYVDGLGDIANSVAPEVLILGIRLQNYNYAVYDPNAILPETAPQAGQSFPDSGVLVSPVLETPVFEDVTLNLTFVRPQILYAEEGAIE
jgi:hypothetical protein